MGRSLGRMAILRRVLRIVAILITLLVLIPVLLMLLLRRTESHDLHRDAAIQPLIPSSGELHARPVSLDDSPCRRLLLSNHSTVPGTHVVLSSRVHDMGGITIIDDETYELLTVEIEEPRSGETISVPSPRVHLFYSTGGSAWVHHCAGIFGTAATGSISLPFVTSPFVRATIDLDVEVTSARDLSTHDPVHVHFAGLYW